MYILLTFINFQIQKLLPQEWPTINKNIKNRSSGSFNFLKTQYQNTNQNIEPIPTKKYVYSFVSTTNLPKYNEPPLVAQFNKKLSLVRNRFRRQKIGQAFQIVQKIGKVSRKVVASIFILTGIYYSQFLVRFLLEI